MIWHLRSNGEVRKLGATSNYDKKREWDLTTVGNWYNLWYMGWACLTLLLVAMAQVALASENGMDKCSVWGHKIGPYLGKYASLNLWHNKHHPSLGIHSIISTWLFTYVPMYLFFINEINPLFVGYQHSKQVKAYNMLWRHARWMPQW